MSLIDARQLESGSELAAQVCIIGAGAAGLTLASSLEGSGIDVCLLESGGMQPESRTQALYDIESVGYPIRENFMSRARYYGGSCNLWAGRSMRFGPGDLEAREWISNSGWPLDHAELARYYPGAARVLQLPDTGLFDAVAHEPSLTGDERRLYADDDVAPTVSLWARRPKRFGAAYRALLERSQNVRLVLHCNAINIVLNEMGDRTQAVDAATLSGVRFRVRAENVVLASGGLENARLLLVSRDRNPRGIGNDRDLVGRYFMDHPRAVFGRVRLSPGARLPHLDGRPRRDGTVQLGLAFSPELQRREALLDHYATFEVEHSEYTARQYQSFIRTMKVLLRRGHAGSRWRPRGARPGDVSGLLYLLAPREIVPHWLYRTYWHMRRLLPDREPGRRVVVYFCEQPPDPASRVTLSEKRDELGLQRLSLDWRVGPSIVDSVLRLQALLKERLEETGLGVLEEGGGEPHFTDASHHMGTTRMSLDPSDGVVDPDGKVHGVRGLFVAGSSVFPSARNRNPTLTIVALALRLADHLKNVV